MAIFFQLIYLSRIPLITIDFYHDFLRCSIEFLDNFFAIEVIIDLKSLFHLLHSSSANIACQI